MLCPEITIQSVGNDTLFALVDGKVKFERLGKSKKQVSVYPVVAE